MKNFLIIINLSILVGILTIFSTSDKNSPNTRPSPIVSKKATQSGFTAKLRPRDETVMEFLMEAAEARMMDLEEGKIAQQRSTSKNLKEYGTLMVKDQSEMLLELKKIAQQKNISLPQTLSEGKAEGLADLKEVHGKSFDKKFIKMMIIDHKRDIKKFENAAASKDADIQVFATKYLPVLQEHLDRIRSLKKDS